SRKPFMPTSAAAAFVPSPCPTTPDAASTDRRTFIDWPRGVPVVKETVLLQPILFVGGFPSCVRAFRPLSTVACFIAVVTRSNCPKQQPWKKWPPCYG